MDPDFDMLRNDPNMLVPTGEMRGATPQTAAADEHCAPLKAELDTAEGTVRVVTEGTRPVGWIG